MNTAVKYIDSAPLTNTKIVSDLGRNSTQVLQVLLRGHKYIYKNTKNGEKMNDIPLQKGKNKENSSQALDYLREDKC